MRNSGRLFLLSLVFAVLISTVWAPRVVAEKENPREKLSELKSQKKDLLEEIAKSDRSLKKYTDQIKNAEEKIDEIQAQIDNKWVELQKAKDEEEWYRHKYHKRIRHLYEQGEFGYMASILSAKSVRQFLDRFEALHLIIKQDYSLLRNKINATAKVDKKKKELEKMRLSQYDLLDKANAAYKEITKKQKKDKGKLADVLEKEAIYREMVMEINKELLNSGRLNFAFKGFTHKPLKKMRITSHFNLKGRVNPVLGYVEPHKGTDFGAEMGTPIYSPGDGVVVENRPASGYGWILSIYHGHKDGKPVISRYGHCYGRDVVVEVGEEVEAGQMISRVGNNGQSTGAHLHFEVRRDFGRYAPAVNPLDWL